MSNKREAGHIPGNGKCQGKGCSRTLSPSKKPSRAGRWHISYGSIRGQNDVLLCPECYRKSR